MNIIKRVLAKIGLKSSMKDPAEIRRLGTVARKYQKPPPIGKNLDRRA